MQGRCDRQCSQHVFTRRGGGVGQGIHRAERSCDPGRMPKDQGPPGRHCPVGEAVITHSRQPSCPICDPYGRPDMEWRSKSRRRITGGLPQQKLSSSRSLMIFAHSPFPNISTGIYRFPKDKAAALAWRTVSDFLDENESIWEVNFVCTDEENYSIYMSK